jgi:hypothetical protein
MHFFNHGSFNYDSAIKRKPKQFSTTVWNNKINITRFMYMYAFMYGVDIQSSYNIYVPATEAISLVRNEIFKAFEFVVPSTYTHI